MDAQRKAPIAKNIEQWKKDPSHYDLVGIDTPKKRSVAHPYLIHVPKNGTSGDYWTIRENQFYPDGEIVGFDLSSVTASLWPSFLKNNGFKKVDECPVNKYGAKPVIYKNASGILMIVEHETKGRDEVDLGYMRFEAPHGKDSELRSVLASFRGPVRILDTDVEYPGGIATYIKEESDRGGFI